MEDKEVKYGLRAKIPELIPEKEEHHYSKIFNSLNRLKEEIEEYEKTEIPFELFIYIPIETDGLTSKECIEKGFIEIPDNSRIINPLSKPIWYKPYPLDKRRKIICKNGGYMVLKPNGFDDYFSNGRILGGKKSLRSFITQQGNEDPNKVFEVGEIGFKSLDEILEMIIGFKSLDEILEMIEQKVL